MSRAEEMRLRVAALEARARGPVADDDDRAGQIELEHRLEILFDRDPSDREKDRPRQVENRVGARAEHRVVHAARPQADLLEAPIREFGADGRRRRHDRRRRRMKAPKPGIGQRFGEAGAGANVFREAGVVARGEDALRLQTVAPRQPADRTLGRDMDVVGRRLLNSPGDPARRRDRHANVRVGGHRRGPHALGRHEIERRAKLSGRLGHPLQGRDDAVDLRPPGVGRNQDAHQAASASTPSRSSSKGVLSSGTTTFSAAGQRMTSNRPSKCSTTSEQDSTKSPVLT